MKENNSVSNIEFLKLQEENEILKAEIQVLKENQQNVKQSLQRFLSKADEMQEIGKKTFNTNIARLKVYELKLISYYNKLVQKYPIDEDIANLSEFVAEMKKVINKDFFSREDFELFGASRELGNRTPTPLEKMAPSESGFDFFEALHPEKDLEELCKELGLMSE